MSDARTNSATQKDRSELEVLTLQKAGALLHDQHNRVFDDHDPIYLLVTLHQGFIADYERMLMRHHTALTAMIGEAVNGLTEEALTNNLQSQVSLADRIGSEFKAQYRRVRLLSLINILAAALCVLTLVYLVAK